MGKLMDAKVETGGLVDTFEMAVFKTITERAAVPVIGNSSVKSGVVKLIAGGFLPSLSGNHHVKLLGSAMIIDGVEDMAHALLGGIIGNADTAGAW